MVRHARPQAEQHALHAFRRQYTGVFEEGDFGRGAAGAQAVRGVHHEVRRVHDRCVAREAAQGVDQIGGEVDGMRAVGMLRIREVFPADAAHLGGCTDPFSGKDLPDLAAGVTGLVEQGEALETLGPQCAREVRRADAEIAFAFVPDNEQRASPRRHDQNRLLEARVEVGEVGQVREMLAIGIDHGMSQSRRGHGRSQRADPGVEFRGFDSRRALGQAELRPFGFDQPMGLGRAMHEIAQNE
jgi:hypothetical protein